MFCNVAYITYNTVYVTFVMYVTYVHIYITYVAWRAYYVMEYNVIYVVLCHIRYIMFHMFCYKCYIATTCRDYVDSISRSMAVSSTIHFFKRKCMKRHV